MKVASFQTTQRVTFTSIATVLIPLGVALLSNKDWVIGLIVIGTGIGSLVIREVFKVPENG